MPSHFKLVVTICCVGSAAACFACAALIDDRPELLVIANPTAFDLGTVPAEDVRSCEISLINRGTLAVKLANKASSCGCTDVTVSTQTLPPGEKAILSAKVKTGAKPGEWTHTVAVDFVNDRGNRHCVVSVPIRLRVEPAGQVVQSSPE